MRNSFKIHLVVLSLSFAGMLAHSAFADDSAGMDAASTDALQNTMKDLNSPSDRDAIVNKDPRAQAADQQLKSVAGGNPATAEAMYGLSGEVFDQIAKESGGNVQKMNDIMAAAQANPAAFYQKYFSDSDKAKLQEISRKISSEPGNPNAAAAPGGGAAAPSQPSQ